ncbi:MAG TPA: hypothetical protein PK536_12865 [Ignavibacteria bacterium]|nr:hypothetical protein [Bacteroidota bacterium]HRI86330.1 hypothetical protein [Ignavibacteria bacterium]HRJ98296.1 hypothetical protein [Ignavibacteria bacterium]
MKKLLITFSLITIFYSCSKQGNSENMKDSVNTKLEAESKNIIKNYLNTPQEINFDGKDFSLLFSSNSPENLYTQEYIQEGDKLEKFNQMILISFMETENSAKDLAISKSKEIEKRKSGDVMANFELTENKERGEILLDFLLSDGAEEDKMIVEWNAYRYLNHTDKSGRKGVLLIGLSKRAYGDKYKEFLSELKANRKKYNTSLVSMEIPVTEIKK